MQGQNPFPQLPEIYSTKATIKDAKVNMGHQWNIRHDRLMRKWRRDVVAYGWRNWGLSISIGKGATVGNEELGEKL